jgi:hypothetical protein
LGQKSRAVGCENLGKILKNKLTCIKINLYLYVSRPSQKRTLNFLEVTSGVAIIVLIRI